MKSQFRFHEVDFGGSFYGISPLLCLRVIFFLIFKSFRNFPFVNLFRWSPVLPCSSLYSAGIDFIVITGVSCRLLCRPYLIAVAAAASASLKPEEGFELKTKANSLTT